MKVFNLRCGSDHDFEGWFASEEDFQDQMGRQLVQCPVCGDTRIRKMLSAPHLNLRSASEPALQPAGTETSPEAEVLQAMYERMVQHVLENTRDVGEAFADQARKMHHGELETAPIRGKTSRDEAQALRDEGIEVVSLPVPKVSKGRLQ